jgi:hypothetical protein
MLWEAAANPRTTSACVNALTDTPALLVDTAVGVVLNRALGHLWTHGWLPYDVFQIVSRNLDERAITITVDAIAAEMEQYASATLHQRWQEQLREIGAAVWWDRGRPHLDQWAGRHIESREDALALVIRVLSTLMSLPGLPLIVSPPGTAHADAAHAGVDQKVLNRVRGLLAKAESTQFPDEAEALSAKAQELMNRHAFERVAIDAKAHVPQTATSRRLWLEKRYLGQKAQLVHAVASANRSRAVIYDKIGFVALVGDEMDLEITELLSTSLLVQATRAMVAAGSRAARGDESRTRPFRQSFLIAYAHRIGERLHAATAAEEDDRLLPVLADRRKAVDELFESLFTRTVTKSVSISSVAGWDAGSAAADTADIGVERTAVTRN